MNAQLANPPTKKLRARPRLWRRIRKNAIGYVFVLPVILGIVFLFGPAMVESLVYSFNEVAVNPTEGGVTMEYIALDNYDRALNRDVTFKAALITVLRDLAINVPVILIFSFLLANILNQKFRGRGFARAIFFLPVIIATGIISKIEVGDLLSGLYGAGTQAMAAQGGATGDTAGGLLNLNAMVEFFYSLGIGTAMLDYIIIALDKLYYVLINSGVQIVIFLSALQSVPISLYEASYVEGCSGWEAFWKITLPIVSPILLVNTIYTIVNSFLDPQSQITEIIHNTTFLRGMYGYGASMTWLYFLAAAAILAVICFLISRVVFFYDE